ncbi:MAG TPA: chemotaxis protein CheA [Spirochaetia bacterium]|nr:chemotaxis protein CheA [Spirochaetia bacterium]
MSDYLDPANEELLKDFFAEAHLQVDLLEQNILALENNPRDRDAVDEIFRAAHTLKGAAATVQMQELAEFTHLIEDVLDRIRSDYLKTDGSVTDTLLTAIDVTKSMLEARTEGAIFREDISGIKSVLQGYLKPSGSKAQVKPKAPQPPTEAVRESTIDDLTEYELLELNEVAGPDATVHRVEVTFNEDHPMNTVGGIQVFASLKAIGTVLRTVPDFERLYEDTFFPTVKYYVAAGESPERIREKITIPEVTTVVAVTPVARTVTKAAPSASKPPSPGIAPDSGSRGTGHPGTTTGTVSSATEPGTEDSSAIQSHPPATTEAVKSGEARKQMALGSVLRVDSKRIDNLLNLVSETVINKASFNQISNQFVESLNAFQTAETSYREKLKDLFDSLPDYLESIQKGGSIKDTKRDIAARFGDLLELFDPFQSSLRNTVAKFRSTSQNLGRITGELQEGVMQIRMVPISQIFLRFPRLVRDLSKSLGKQVQLIVEGEDTELDKSVIEDLLDPLIHCVRNSIDHGVEKPEERRAAGKPEEGKLLLRAANEGNMIIIEIADDGRGIEIEQVRKRAVEKSMIHPSKALSDVEAFGLIFAPGFSTSKAVTNISGRGVGLDVVKKQIEKLNGTVTVSSERGVGSRFVMKIPLTLAIIQGLLVRVGPETYAIPITSVIESHRIRPAEIKMLDNYEVFNVRDDVVSLLRLNRLFRISTNEQRDFYFVVIVGSGSRKMGLIVDSLIGEEDVVIKPLRDHYTNSPGIAGANITGDGTVSLIIDVSQLLELGLQREREARSKRETTIG